MAAPLAVSGSNATQPSKPELQRLIMDTLEIPAHQTTAYNKGDIRMAYTRYLAVQNAQKRLSKLCDDGTWTLKMPILEDIAGVFGSKSAYFNHNQLFASVHKHPGVQKWLERADDAPTDGKLWGGKKPTFGKLEAIMEKNERKLKKSEKKSEHDKKGKKCQDNSSSESLEKITKKKGKGKEEGASKKGSSSKSGRL
jgi:hypothetical protein